MDYWIGPLEERCHKHRQQLLLLLVLAGLQSPRSWRLEAIASWLENDRTGRAATFAPMLLAVGERGETLPAALKDAGLRFLAMVRWIPEDPVWGLDEVVAILDEFVECLGGSKGLAWLESHVGQRVANAWFPPDGLASAKAFYNYALRWAAKD